MAQLGVHGILGLYIGARLGMGRPWLRGGLVLGSMLPDADLLPAAAAYILDQRESYLLDQSLTHSIAAALLPLVVCGLIGRSRGPNYTHLGLGLSLGALVHSMTDILLWYAPVNAFWPLSLLGFPTIDLWRGTRPSQLVANLLGAAEAIAFLVYYLCLYFEAHGRGLNRDFMGSLRLLIVLHGILSGLFATLAFFLSGSSFLLVVYCPFILLFGPVSVYATVRLWPTIEARTATPRLAIE